MLEIHDIRVEVEALSLPYRYKLMIQTKQRSTTVDRGMLGTAPSVAEQFLALQCLHYAGGRPLCVEDWLISLTTMPEAADQEFLKSAPGPMGDRTGAVNCRRTRHSSHICQRRNGFRPWSCKQRTLPDHRKTDMERGTRRHVHCGNQPS